MNGESTCMVWPTLGSRTAKEQNRTEHGEALRHVTGRAFQITGLKSELYIPWSELSRRKLSPTLATAHYSFPDNAIELSGYVKLG